VVKASLCTRPFWGIAAAHEVRRSSSSVSEHTCSSWDANAGAAERRRPRPNTAAPARRSIVLAVAWLRPVSEQGRNQLPRGPRRAPDTPS